MVLYQILITTSHILEGETIQMILTTFGDHTSRQTSGIFKNKLKYLHSNNFNFLKYKMQ